MINFTKVTSFILVGLSDHPPTMNGLFVLFLLIYLMTLIMNLLILFLVLTDYRLHNPMYFFLSNLALLDMSYSSVTGPKLLFNLATKSQSITIPACITQVFFLIYLATSELLLLSAMSYDRYIAICRPLHYAQIMSLKVCSHLVAFIWVFPCLYSLLHALSLLRLDFCGPNSIDNFFCDLPPLFHISCIDPTVNMMLIFTAGSSVSLIAFLLTFLPYIHIFKTVLRIPSKAGKLKAFSTCTSHLTVVSIFYGSIILIYLVPASSNLFSMKKIFSILYTLINPLLNPLIYSLRNADLKAAFMRTIKRQKHLTNSWLH